MSVRITVETTIKSPIEKVWDSWTQPQHVMNWNYASEEWHCPQAENDLRIGGKFSYTMAAKDGSFSFDFWGIYIDINEHKNIVVRLADDRNLEIKFTSVGDKTHVSETFDSETENTVELQQTGWQSILDTFKKYTESL